MTRPTPTDPTPRQIEVLHLLAQGLTTIQIAEKLFISPNTSRTHARGACKRLGAHSRAQAVATAYEKRLLRPTWDTAVTDTQAQAANTAARALAHRWASVLGQSLREKALRDAGRALLATLDHPAHRKEHP